MKRTYITLFAFFLLSAGHAFSQTKADTVKVQLKIKELKNLENKLRKQIETEDKKRNSIIAGVSEESMFAINEQQDSICLSLRSRLVDCQLEQKELEAVITPQTQTPASQLPASLTQGLQNMAQGTSVSTPSKPTKPSTPSKPQKK